MKKKIIIAAITIIVIILATWGWNHWFSRTRIAFVNYQAIELAQISRANDNGMIKIENLSAENLDELNKYDHFVDIVILNQQLCPYSSANYQS